MKEDIINNKERALDWWRNLSLAEKERVSKSWKATKDVDYRKKWDVRRINISDDTIEYLFNMFVE